MKLFSKKLKKLNSGSLKKHLSKSFLWKGIEANNVGNVYKEIVKDLTGFKNTKIVSWNGSTLKVKANSATQKQEMELKKEILKNRLREKGIQIKAIEILF